MKNLTSAETLDDLLSLNDEAFISCAYSTVLLRAPDPSGYGYYLARLRNGYSKVHILGQLRLSKEGRAVAISLPRLDDAIRREKRSRIPVFGYFFRIIERTEGETLLSKKLRVISNDVYLSRKISQSILDKLPQQNLGGGVGIPQIGDAGRVMGTGAQLPSGLATEKFVSIDDVALPDLSRQGKIFYRRFAIGTDSNTQRFA